MTFKWNQIHPRQEEKKDAVLLEVCSLQNWMQSSDRDSGQAAHLSRPRAPRNTAHRNNRPCCEADPEEADFPTKYLTAKAAPGMGFEARSKLGYRVTALSWMALFQSS